jgi:TRAP-type C4-dicarboxylate transport system permease small subunit
MITWLTSACSYLAGIALLGMAFLGVADIIGIQVFASPVPGIVELTSSLMVASIFLGLPVTEARGQNVRVEVLVERAPHTLRRVLALLSRFSMALLFGLVAWFGSQSLIRSIETNEYAEGLIRVPYWPARLALVAGAALVVLQALSAAVREFRTGAVEQDTGTTWKV